MKRRILASLTILLLLTVPVVGADKVQPLPKDLPPYGELKPFRPPQVTTLTLGNGLTLWLVPRPGFPKISYTLAVRGGFATDPQDLPGLAELLASTVDQGTTSRTARDIAKDLQAAGGDLSARAGSESITLTTSVLSSKAEAGLAILADAALHASFPDSEVALAKSNAADRLAASEADPSYLAERAMAHALFGEHPYRIVGLTKETIAKATAGDLRSEYARRFRPDQAILVAVGDFDPGKLQEMVERHLGNWQSPQTPLVPSVERPPYAPPHAVDAVNRPDSVQTMIGFGSIVPTEGNQDYAPMEVANALFGGMFGSRLTRNIREDKGYTYTPFSFVSPHRTVGVFQTWVPVRNEVTGATINEIDYELNRMATTSPSDEELGGAKRFLVGNRAIELQSQDSVGRSLARIWILGLPPGELGEENESIGRVNQGDVNRVASQYFPAARQTIVTVGVEKVIKDQLAPFELEVKPAP